MESPLRDRRVAAKSRASTASSGAGTPPVAQPPRAKPVSTIANRLAAASLTFCSGSVASAVN